MKIAQEMKSWLETISFRSVSISRIGFAWPNEMGSSLYTQYDRNKRYYWMVQLTAVLTDTISKAASDVFLFHSLAWNRFDFIKLVCCDVGIEPNEESSERWRCYSRHHSFVATQFYSLCHQYCVRDHVFVVCLILRFDSTIRAEPHKILSIWTWRDWGVDASNVVRSSQWSFYARHLVDGSKVSYIFDGMK